MTNFNKLLTFIILVLSNKIKNESLIRSVENHPLFNKKTIMKSDHSTSRESFSCKTCFE